MGFLFGLLIGTSLSSSGLQSATTNAMLGIPLRCIAAFEQSDDAYKKCRRLSLAAEIHIQIDNAPDYLTGMDTREAVVASLEEGLKLEVIALHELEIAAAKKQPDKQ